MMARRIFLVGVSCVGKTTIGRRLAEIFGLPFFDLDEEVERFFGASIERLHKRFDSMEEFRRKSSLVISHIASRKGAEDFLIVLPPRGLMGPYLRAVRQVGGLTVVLKDRPENILARITFYDIDSKPIEKHPSDEENRLYLKAIKGDLAYFNRSYRKADLTVDLSDTRGVEEAAAKVEKSLSAMGPPG